MKIISDPANKRFYRRIHIENSEYSSINKWANIYTRKRLLGSL